MSDNGGVVKQLVTVELKEGSMNVSFGECNLALLSHAVRLASLELDNLIIGANQPAIEEAPPGFLDRMNKDLG